MGKSEWGRINDDQHWRALTVDVGRALFGVNWPAHALPLIFYVIERSWAARSVNKKRPDAEPVAINLTDLARQWDVPRQRLHEAKNWLIANKVWTETVNGFLFNKRADHWGTGTPGKEDFQGLLKPGMLTYAASARIRSEDELPPNSRAPDVPTDTDESVTPQRDKTGQQIPMSLSRPSVTSMDAQASVCHAPALHRVTLGRDTVSRPSVTRNGEISAPPRPPMGERGREIQSLEIREEHTPPTPSEPEPRSEPEPGGVGVGVGGLAGSRSDSESNGVPVTPPPEPMASCPPPPEFLDLCSKAKLIPALEAVRFARTLHRAWNTTEGTDLTNWWLYGNIPAKAWQDALLTLAGRPVELRTVAFFVGIAKNPNVRNRHERAEREAKATAGKPDPPPNYYTCKFPTRPVPEIRIGAKAKDDTTPKGGHA